MIRPNRPFSDQSSLDLVADLGTIAALPSYTFFVFVFRVGLSRDWCLFNRIIPMAFFVFARHPKECIYSAKSISIQYLILLCFVAGSSQRRGWAHVPEGMFFINTSLEIFVTLIKQNETHPRKNVLYRIRWPAACNCLRLSRYPAYKQYESVCMTLFWLSVHYSRTWCCGGLSSLWRY